MLLGLPKKHSVFLTTRMILMSLTHLALTPGIRLKTYPILLEATTTAK